MKKSFLNFEINDSKYQYLLSQQVDKRFNRHLSIGTNLVLNYTDNTEVLHQHIDDTMVVVVGLCVDAYKKLERAQIPNYILSLIDSNDKSSISILAANTSRFAGKYIILLKNKTGLFMIGDATSSLPIYYSDVENSVYASSSEHLLATHIGFSKSTSSTKIQSLAAANMPLPYNLSHYENLLFLLPNHLVNITTKEVMRYSTKVSIPEYKNEVEVLERTKLLINNITEEYAKYYKLVCPLTAGTDSRVVLSFLHNVNKQTECYTLKFDNTSDTSDELVVPKKICKALGINHSTIEVLESSKSNIDSAYSIIGRNNITEQRLNLSLTLREKFDQDNAIIYGDIIDQIGKSGTFGDTPNIFATNSYLNTKTHSFSKRNFEVTKTYINKLKKEVNYSSVYDYFALEIRCGRWASQNSEVNNSLGVNMLNIFNNTEVIMLWMTLNRTNRKNLVVHKYFLKNQLPTLDAYPFNPDSKVKKIKNNKYLYALASYIKFYYQKNKIRKNSF
ncbi:hypothetical protein [Acinetobacter sp. YH12116]|uniref:hypothetical protein n=1 Tax=Acinetobacter sp. YH12116 TaxID=2601103 RepID=UPI0015D376E8|nr:hypothetical protein [Acinetobacter sp. YH12116]